MKVFIFIRGCGVSSVDQRLYDTLKEVVLQNGWQETTLYIDQQFQPLFYASGICPIFEIMKHCACDLLLVAGAEHISICPEQLMKFNAMIMDKGMRVYLYLEQQYLDEWVYDFKLLEA